MKRHQSRGMTAAMIALLALLLLPPPALSDGADVRTVAQFSGGSSEATFYIGPGPGTNRTNITMPRSAVLRSAGISIEGMPGRDGSFPSGASLQLGGQTVWEFGVSQDIAGQMGHQAAFPAGQANLTLDFPPGGGAATRPGPLLPAGAEVREATLEVALSAGPLPPRVYSPAAPASSVFWDDGGATVVQASAAAGAVTFSGRDAVSGVVRWSRPVNPALSGGAFVADIQYLPDTDQAALLLPGKGVLVVNLSSGWEQEYFTGPGADTLDAMRFSRGSLAVLGDSWAAVRDLVSGAEDRVDSTEFPQAGWYGAVAVDYDQPGRRLMIAGRGPSAFQKTVSVFSLGERTAKLLSDTSVTSIPASLLYVPETDSVLLGLSGGGSVDGRSNDRPAITLSLSDGTVGYLPAFEDLRGISVLRRQGGLVCAIGELATGGPRLVLVDAQDRSWRTFPGLGADWSSSRSWAYDPSNGRLLTLSSTGALEVFELDFALAAGTSWRLPEPGLPVPGQVTVVLARGGDIIAGTDNGLTAIGPDGRRIWTVHCGRVEAVAEDPVTGRVLAAALGGLRCEPGAGRWYEGILRLLELDLAGAAPVDRGFSVRLPADWRYTAVEGIAACPRNGTVFVSLSSYYTFGLFEARPGGTLLPVQTPSVSVGALALSPDGRTLYAACRGAGLLVLDIATGAQELQTPFSEAPLLSPSVVSIDVDGSGAVLVGQSPASGYFPGGVSLLARSANGTLETVFGQEIPDGPVRGATRDPSGGRIFVSTGTTLAVLDETDGTRLDVSSGVYLSSIDWSSVGDLLAGAGSGAALGLDWTAGAASNLSLDVGDDGTAGWSGQVAPGAPERIDISEDLSRYLAGRNAAQRFTEVPLRVDLDSSGLVQLRSLSVTYRLSERVDLMEALSGLLRSLPASGNASVPLDVSATGGALRLHSLAITFETGSAPYGRVLPELRLDTGAAAPAILDLSRYFTDDRTAPSNLTFVLEPASRPSGVGVSLLFGHYVLADARGASFRGEVKVTVKATDEQGLSSSSDLRVRVFRSGEYVPPPAYYGTLAWAFGAVVLVLGLAAIRLFVRGRRKPE